MGSGIFFIWSRPLYLNYELKTFEGFSFLKKAAPVAPIDTEDLNWLLCHTKRDETNIKEMHRKFASDYSSGTILRQ